VVLGYIDLSEWAKVGGVCVDRVCVPVCEEGVGLAKSVHMFAFLGGEWFSTEWSECLPYAAEQVLGFGEAHSG
jgi:hypothetical protein